MDEYSNYKNPKRFYRPTNDRMIGGVCAGIAERMGWDPLLVRIAAVVSMITGVFSGVVFAGYLITWAVTPKRRTMHNMTKDEESFWQGVSDRPKVTLSNIRYKFMDLEDRMQGVEKAVTSDEWRLRRQFRDLEKS
ncbi:envelope stress response membrane protein PspC [Hirschia baltica]|uniref:Phage shock protein C, PspC n=1 Tax=Hirschia baltica (strain ATCC 49814 / DSM 5838 / IFAM 1418) TaxID=582402 RepID=C6XR67_HIRBI|nr:envelope stress response membrane protein PspC [Hirschia baltica]ACT60598.1 phage shock protein C, PspC [Hirschia baltica ATCC 49814]